MKKKYYFTLIFFLIIFIFNNFAFSETIISPLYFPEAGKILSNMNIGYNRNRFTLSETNKKFENYYFLKEEGKFGLFENLSVNFGFQYEINKKHNEINISNDFSLFYFGILNRILDKEHFKFDISVNVGKETIENFTKLTTNFLNIYALYGFNFEYYNTSLKISYKYNDNYKDENYKLNNSYILSFIYNNQLILFEDFSLDLDLIFNHINKVKEYKNIFHKSYNEYGYNISLNYYINYNNSLGLFYNFRKNKINFNDNLINKKNKIVSNCGLKLVSKF